MTTEADAASIRVAPPFLADHVMKGDAHMGGIDAPNMGSGGAVRVVLLQTFHRSPACLCATHFSSADAAIAYLSTAHSASGANLDRIYGEIVAGHGRRVVVDEDSVSAVLINTSEVIDGAELCRTLFGVASCETRYAMAALKARGYRWRLGSNGDPEAVPVSVVVGDSADSPPFTGWMGPDGFRPREGRPVRESLSQAIARVFDKGREKAVTVVFDRHMSVSSVRKTAVGMIERGDIPTDVLEELVNENEGWWGEF